MYNPHIDGLVTHRSSVKRTRKPIGERASSKLRYSVTADSYAATKPKARSPMGFLLSATRTPHDSKHPSRGGAEEKRTRYDASLGGSSRTIRATGRIIKSRGRTNVRMMIPFTGVKHLLLSIPPLWGRGVFG